MPVAASPTAGAAPHAPTRTPSSSRTSLNGLKPASDNGHGESSCEDGNAQGIPNLEQHQQEPHSLDPASLLSLPDEELALIMDSLLKSIRSNQYYERSELSFLIRCARERGIIPLSLFLEGVERLGTDPASGGGFADVWKGTYQGKCVAIKTLRMFSGGDYEDLKKNISKEALLWHMLDHPNVQPFLGVTVLQSGDVERYSLITPWVAEGNMMSYLKKNMKGSRRELFYGIAAGLSYLHSCNIVHADLRKHPH